MRPEPKLQLAIGVAFCVVALGFLLLFFLKPELFHRSTAHRTAFEDVSGLRVGAEVIYAGYVVGRVSRIEPRFAEGRFDVTLRLSPDWSRPDGIVAEIDESNPFRPASVALALNPDCAAEAGDGDGIPGCGRRANVIDMATTVATQAVSILDLAKSVLAGIEAEGQGPGLDAAQGIMARGQKIVENLEAVTDALRGLVSEQRTAAVGQAIDDLATATATLKKLASEQRVATVGVAIDDLATATKMLKSLASEDRIEMVGRAVDGLLAATAAMGKLATDERTAAVGQAVDDLATAMATLKRLASEDRIEAVGGAVDQLTQATDTLLTLFNQERIDRVGGAVDDLATASRAARQIMDQATVVMDKANKVDPEVLNRTALSIERTTNTVGDLIAKNEETITTTLSETKFLLQTTSVSMQQVLLNLEEASRTLNDLMARLRDDPSVLLHGRAFRTPGGGGAPN